MTRLTGSSRFSALASIRWKSAEAAHTEQYFAGKCNMWRDVFPAGLHQALLGKIRGEEASVTVRAGQHLANYSERLVVSIRPDQFDTHRAGEPIIPAPGRYYPQHLLSGVPGVFRTSLAPCRFLGEQGGRLLFDLNHPLAGRELDVSFEVIEIIDQPTERGGRCEDWLEIIANDGPGMQSRLPEKPTAFFSGDWCACADDRDDQDFYRQPRLVHHLDETARKRLRNEYGKLIPDQGEVLDLMASWDSHLDSRKRISSLTVLGMNRVELEANNRADKRLIHNLNDNMRLPFDSQSFDTVLCTASIEYLKEPVPVMREIGRVLRPNGKVAIAFSNRWFPAKTIALWPELHAFERLGLVQEMMASAQCFSHYTTLSVRGFPRPQNDRHQDQMYSDPLFLVTAARK